ncbi:hypothetical protein EJ03DRAFT_325064 [Teratosphaeria nubilosa]|uniref:CBM1 domain-containing protein n=1 Tax=Teratosphaeria nubilosa TaxID=161662 RepID=A0A6G1LH15_9PEZI|nr:hypothetical protein EJ03DRAFT_325064 [Teratosphaeria nubilosa]
MQFSTLTTLFAASLFVTGTLGYYNCCRTGTTDCKVNYGGSNGGWCVGNGENEGNYKKCDPNYPCKTAHNGCSWMGAGALAHCSNH